MDCRQVQSRLCELSAEAVPASYATAVNDHLAGCAHCREEWQNLQATLLILSTTSQPVLWSSQSEKMWRGCSELLHERIEERRVGAGSPFLWRWMQSQPTWGWAALGSAILVFGSVWWFTPQESHGPSGVVATTAFSSPPSTSLTAADLADTDLPSSELPGVDSSSPGPLVSFQRPPRDASTFVDHHAAMAFDPFTDHVGSTLVSSSATALGPASGAR